MTCTLRTGVPAFPSEDGLPTGPEGSPMKNSMWKRVVAGVGVVMGVLLWSAPRTLGSANKPDQVLEWNQIFIDTLIATNTANSSSPRLGAIVHAAIFDAYNGIEERYTPIYV